MPQGIRIYQGETIAGLAWANATLLIGGDFSIVYDEGSEDIFSLNMATTTNARARTALNTKRVAKHDGYVVSGSIWQLAGTSNTTAAQRGSCYTLLGISDKETQGGSAVTFPTRLRTLCCGYLYLGHPLSLGELVEPGPSGGSGHMREISITAAAVGGVTGSVVTAVPTNAIWRILGGLGLYGASATVGTRAAVVRFRDNAGNTYQVSSSMAPTAGQTARYECAPNLTSDTTVGLLGANVSIETASPDRGISAGYDIFVQDNANIDSADTFALELQVEEWVVPGV